MLATREDRLCMRKSEKSQTADVEAEKQMKGVITLPVSLEPNLYAAREADVDNAIRERYEKKARWPYISTRRIEDLAKMTQTLIGKKGSAGKCARAAVSHCCVMEWWSEHLFDDMKSKTWNEARVANSMKELLQDIDPSFDFKTAVKFEHMRKGKSATLPHS